MSNHVTRGRQMLRKRLTRQGITLSAAALAVQMADLAQAAGPLSPMQVSQTTAAALQYAAGVSLAQISTSQIVNQAARGVIRAMTVTKLTVLGAAALAVLFAASTFESVAHVFSSVASAETIFFDDFQDGDATDGSPTSWGAPFAGFLGALDASSGDLLIRPTPSGRGTVATPVPQLFLRDVSIRAQARILESSPQFQGLELLARGSEIEGELYQAGLDENGRAYITTNLRRLDFFGSAVTDLRPLEEEVVLQFDVIGTSLSLWAWRPGEQRPRQPLVSITDSSLTEPGIVGIDYYLLEPDANLGSAVYRYVHVANASISEPSTATLSAIFFAGLFVFQYRRMR